MVKISKVKKIKFLASEKQKIFIALLGFAVVLFVAERVGILARLQAPWQKAFEPLQLALYKTKKDFDSFVQAIGEIRSLRGRENKLATENALLQAENARLARLEAENKLLREQLGITQREQKLIAAQIIGSDPLLSASSLLVDQGKDEGVVVGALVILKDILIGQVSAVGSSTASVRLLSDPATKIPAITASGTKGILQGEFGYQVILDRVVQGEKLNAGELVYTLGEAGFPKGLVLGKIAKLKSGSADLFQKATVEPLIPSQSLEMVFIVQK